MITTIVQFSLPKPLTVEEAGEIFNSTAPKYRHIKGLIRKTYILSEDGKTGGGVYHWQSRHDAEQMYTEEWREFITQKYGAAPSVLYFESPVVVDNISGKILSEI